MLPLSEKQSSEWMNNHLKYKGKKRKFIQSTYSVERSNKQRSTKVCAKPMIFNIVINENEGWMKSETAKFFGIIKSFKTKEMRTI